ncbi:MAG: acetyl-CoA C-acetyltransferase [Gemmataceae bacterium]|nr:acetyl-CoA C-acetyltransferase [Gemmataceae bacterium]
MSEVVIVSAVRSPIGKFLGGLGDLAAPHIAAPVLKEALLRAKVDPSAVDEVIMGHVVQAGVGQNPARQAAIHSGLPSSIAAFTVNKVCGSGLKAVMLAAQAIKAGDAQIVLAGGMESMSRAPHIIPNSRTGIKYGDGQLVDALVRDGLWCAFENWPMGDAAEHIARKHDVTRADQDKFSEASHKKAAAAWEAGAFAAEVLPITVGSGTKAKTVSKDEGIRPETTLESLGKLRPAFKADGTVTAGNASQLSDGAAGLVVASRATADKLGAKPLARIVSYATAGVDPKDIFIAPVPAVKMALEKAKFGINDIDLFELNEAFAAQMCACAKGLNIPDEKVNVNGGAVALGHPIGASGARVLVSLVHAMEKRGAKRGVASLCLGGGNAVAMVVERM